MKIKLTFKNLILNNYYKVRRLKRLYKILLYLWILFFVFAITFVTISFKYKLQTIIPLRLPYEQFEGNEIGFNNLSSTQKITKEVAGSTISWENETHNISFTNHDLTLNLYPSELIRTKLFPHVDAHFFHREQKDALYAPFVAQVCFTTDTASSISINGKSKFVSVDKVIALTSHAGFLITYKIISDPRDVSLIPHLLSPREMDNLKKLIVRKVGVGDAITLIDSLQTCYTRDEGKANKNSKYTFGFPPSASDFHINNIFRIWYEVYQLTDQKLLQFNVGKVINKYEFLIPIAYYIKADQLVTSVLTDQIKQNSPVIDGGRWVLSNLQINPGLLTIVNQKNMLLLPDGTGVIASADKINHWSGRVYEQDFYLFKQDPTVINPTIKVPVMGVNLMQATNNYGLLMHLSEGAFQAKLFCSKTVIFGNDDKLDLRRLYPEFTLKFKGERYFLGDTKTDAYSPIYDQDRFSVAYKIIKRIDNKPISYYDYAQVYAKLTNTRNNMHNYQPEVPVNIIQTITKTGHFLGVPREKQFILTSNDELWQIKQHLAGISKTFFLTNWQRGALYGSIPAHHLKNAAGLGQPLSYQDANFYFINSLIKCYSENAGSFRNRYDGMQILAGETRTFKELDVRDNDYSGKKYYLLNPKKLLSTIDYFTRYNNFASVAIDDLGYLPYGDFSDARLSPAVIKQIVMQALISAKSQNLALKMPYYDYVHHADIIYDLALDYSGNPLYYAQVPFTSLLYSLYHKVLLPATNLDSKNRPSSYYLTYALLTNTYPTFTLSGRETTITRDAKNDNQYYNTYFNYNQASINHFYQKITEFRAQVGSKIIAHNLVAPELFLVTYDYEGSFKHVLFNLGGTYQDYVDSLHQHYHVPPNDYLVIS